MVRQLSWDLKNIGKTWHRNIPQWRDKRLKIVIVMIVIVHPMLSIDCIYIKQLLIKLKDE